MSPGPLPDGGHCSAPFRRRRPCSSSCICVADVAAGDGRFDAAGGGPVAEVFGRVIELRERGHEPPCRCGMTEWRWLSG